MVGGARPPEREVGGHRIRRALDPRRGREAQLVGIALPDGVLALRDHAEVLLVVVRPYDRPVVRRYRGGGRRMRGGATEGPAGRFPPRLELTAPLLAEGEQRHRAGRVIEDERSIDAQHGRIRMLARGPERLPHCVGAVVVADPADPAETEATATGNLDVGVRGGLPPEGVQQQLTWPRRDPGGCAPHGTHTVARRRAAVEPEGVLILRMQREVCAFRVQPQPQWSFKNPSTHTLTI